MARTLGDIFEICTQNGQSVLPQQVALGQFDLIARHLGEGWESIEATASWLDEAFPEKPEETDPKVETFGGLRLWRSCRVALLKLIVECTDDTAQDPFKSLRILGRAGGLAAEVSDLKAPLKNTLGPDVEPAKITREQAVEADLTLFGNDRWRFRKSLATLDRLRALPSVREKKLLPVETIGPMQAYRKTGLVALELPPRLGEFCRPLRNSDRTAFQAVFECGVADGLFDATDDIAPEDLIAPPMFQSLLHAMEKTHSDKTRKIYVNRVIKAVLNAYPDRHHPDPWTALRGAARKAAPGLSLDILSYFKIRSAGKGPGELDQGWFDGVLAAERKDNTRSQLKRAGRLLNDLRGIGDGSLLPFLPREPLQVPNRIQKGQPKQTPPPPDDWDLLIAAVTRFGLSRNDIHALGSVRSAAIRGDRILLPRDLSQTWALEALSVITASSSRVRFRRGIVCVDSLRGNEALGVTLPDAPLGPMPENRCRGNGTLPAALREEIQDHCDFRGLQLSASRSVMAAVTTIFTNARQKELFDTSLADIPFGRIIEDIELNPSSLPKRWTRIRAAGLQLQTELGITWTKPWADLQRLAVEAGLSVKENPVPAIAGAAMASGLSPSEIDREWAWQHEVTLRPDLQITWSTNVDRFDQLRGIPAIAASTLLPQKRLGPMPPRGCRARHGVYPLPRAVEELLDGIGDAGSRYSRKQLNETAHFIWRYARELKLFSRGDEPEVGEVFGELAVETILQTAPHGLGSAALKEHRHRIGTLQFHASVEDFA